MTPVSHALLPVFLGQRWIPHHNRVPAIKAVLIVAFCGVLPDLLSPHLSLDARHTALSHTVWAFLAFSLVVGLLAWRWPTVFSRPMTVLCVVAYGGHLLCDAITGRVALFHPFWPAIQGKNVLPYWLWIACDGSLLLYLYLVYRWLPLRRKIKARNHPSPLQNPDIPDFSP